MTSLSGAHDDFELDSSGDPRQADLMLRSQQGDRLAYGQMVIAYQDRLFNAILRMVGDREEARDLTQETFTKALEKIETFRGECAPYTWFFKIAANLSISQLRKLQRRRTFSLDNNAAYRGNEQGDALSKKIAATTQDPSDALERSEEQQQVLWALGRLDAEYRAILVMRDVEDFDYQQMADILGLPLGTLKSRLFRARLALNDELKAYMKE